MLIVFLHGAPVRNVFSFFINIIYIGSFARVLKSQCTRLCSRALFIHSLCNLFISAVWFFFLSGPSTVLEEKACTLQHDDSSFQLGSLAAEGGTG